MKRLAAAASLLCSAAYFWAVVSGRTFAGHWLVKATAIALLAVFVCSGRRTRASSVTAAGLLTCSVGDALLSLGADLFLAGLAAFLCGHLLYIRAFAAQGDSRKTVVPALLFAVYGAFLYLWLDPFLDGLRLPVALYAAAIVAMAASSFRVGGMLSAGAALFVLSDSVLALNRFRQPLPLADILVWGSYYAGQFLIALGTARQASAAIAGSFPGRAWSRSAS